MVHMATKVERQINSKSQSSSTPNRDVKCSECLGKGHIAPQCPNQRVMIPRGNGEIESESEETSPSKDSGDKRWHIMLRGRHWL